jgi:hypothetical protein
MDRRNEGLTKGDDGLPRSDGSLSRKGDGQPRDEEGHTGRNEGLTKEDDGLPRSDGSLSRKSEGQPRDGEGYTGRNGGRGECLRRKVEQNGHHRVWKLPEHRKTDLWMRNRRWDTSTQGMGGSRTMLYKEHREDELPEIDVLRDLSAKIT